MSTTNGRGGEADGSRSRPWSRETWIATRRGCIIQHMLKCRSVLSGPAAPGASSLELEAKLSRGLGDPAPLAMLRALADWPRSAGELAGSLGLSPARTLRTMQTKSLTYTFASSGPFADACREPGPYEAGMREVINVASS